MNTIFLVLIILVVLGRILYWLKPIQGARGDVQVYRTQSRIAAAKGLTAVVRSRPEKGQEFTPPSIRVLWIAWGALCTRIWGDSLRGLSGMATALGLLSGAIGYVLGECLRPGVGIATALLVLTSPLSTGLARRALVDAPSAFAVFGLVTFPFAVSAVAWPVLLVLALTTLFLKESTRTFFPALFGLTWWLWGPAYAAFVYGGAFVIWYYIVTIWISRPALRPLRLAIDPTKEEDYARRYCHGGLHRLVTDLVLVSPVALLGSMYGAKECGLVIVLAAAFVVLYSRPALNQQVRTILVVDYLLRAVVAVTCPVWVILLCLAADAWIFTRAWLKGKLYDPTTVGLYATLLHGNK